tara:strand:+ start:46681 stop:47262 length:582 start_codon:yes stop_codon:yes gene_type:complete
MVKRIAVIGPYRVGKTCLILRYLNQPFTESYISTMFGEPYETHGVTRDIIWDTPSSQRFEIDRKLWARASGFVLCFNPFDDDSFFLALNLADEIEIGDKPVVMAATYADRGAVNIKPAWSQEASVRGWKIIRTSSKSNTGVTHVFGEIFAQTPESNTVELGRLEYATSVMSSCIYSGVNNYIYELDRDYSGMD